MYRLTFYVPESHLEPVKAALFDAGAGRLGDYDCCCWQTVGHGQFRPLAGSQPFLGTPGQLESVKEYQVEMVCEAAVIQQVIAALKNSHPYEQPAYFVAKLEQF